MKIDHSVVVITGASSGIGRATAIELASRGATLVLASRDAVALEDVVAECEAAGGAAVAVATDVTREEEVEAVGRLAVSRFGRIDVWVNNAAVALFATFENAPSDVYRRVIETNVFGYVHGARVALRQFKAQHRGVLINIDSVTAGAPQPYTSAYVASKFAVRGLSACLRMELSLESEHDIYVCNVMPAAIDTPLFQHAANYTGRAVKALDPVYPATKVARAIAALIEKPRAEVVVGKAGLVMMANARTSPRLYERFAARHIDRNHLQDRPTGPTQGNLFLTTAPKAVEGGWRRRGTITAKVRRGAWPAAVAGAAVLTALALAATKRRS
ncbi:MAG TPA: SDR family oxidoreductase [Thermoanaerobaculia bacterium]|nr:SDR family oxidoreductase [Thermoanaerobaculia bacterium]